MRQVALVIALLLAQTMLSGCVTESEDGKDDGGLTLGLASLDIRVLEAERAGGSCTRGGDAATCHEVRVRVFNVSGGSYEGWTANVTKPHWWAVGSDGDRYDPETVRGPSRVGHGENATVNLTFELPEEVWLERVRYHATGTGGEIDEAASVPPYDSG